MLHSFFQSFAIKKTHETRDPWTLWTHRYPRSLDSMNTQIPAILWLYEFTKTRDPLTLWTHGNPRPFDSKNPRKPATPWLDEHRLSFNIIRVHFLHGLGHFGNRTNLIDPLGFSYQNQSFWFWFNCALLFKLFENLWCFKVYYTVYSIHNRIIDGRMENSIKGRHIRYNLR